MKNARGTSDAVPFLVFAVLVTGAIGGLVLVAPPATNNTAANTAPESDASRYETSSSQWHSPPKTVIEQGSGVGFADYIIFKGDEGSIYAKSGDSGGIALASDNAAYVIQEVVNRLADNGGKIFVRHGNFTLDSTIAMENGITIMGEGPGLASPPPTQLTFDNVPGFLIENLKDISIQDLKIYATVDNQGYGVKVTGNTNSVMLNRLKISGGFTDAVWILNQGGSNRQNSILRSMLVGENYAIHFQGAADWNIMSDWVNAVLMENGTSAAASVTDQTNDRIDFINTKIHVGPSTVQPQKDIGIKIKERRTNHVSLIGGIIESWDEAGIGITKNSNVDLRIYGTSFYMGDKPPIKLKPTADYGVDPTISFQGQGGHPYDLAAGASPENIYNPYEIPEQVAANTYQWFGSAENAYIELRSDEFRMHGGADRVNILSNDNPCFKVWRDGTQKLAVFSDRMQMYENLDMGGENIKNVSKVMIENMYDLDPQSSAPASAEAGTVAMSDGTNWDVDGDGYAELAIYNGTSWLVIENMETTY